MYHRFRSSPARMGILAAVTLVGAACSPAATPAPTAAPKPAAAAPAPSPSTAPAERVEGTVQALANNTLSLSNGRSVSVTANTRVTRQTNITPSDLKQGDYVAITAKRQPDNTLLASIVNVFPPSLGQVAPGQRPLPEGNLMTNASIDTLSGNQFTVTFPGGGARVQVAPDAKVTRQLDVSFTEVKAGDNVTVQVVDGAARSITVNPGA